MRQLLYFCFLVYFVNGSDLEYCSITCYGEQHTNCVRSIYGCGAGPKCGARFSDQMITKVERNTILAEMNKARNAIAIGNTTLPKAANMIELGYSRELENIAQCWVNSCEAFNDKCRNTVFGDIVAQNIIEAVHVKRLHRNEIIEEIIRIINFWFGSISFTNPLNYEPVKDYTDLYNFYRMISADTQYVGCGLSMWQNEEGRYVYLFACNFAPSVILEKYVQAYDWGETTSLCGNKVSNLYSGLCSHY